MRGHCGPSLFTLWIHDLARVGETRLYFSDFLCSVAHFLYKSELFVQRENGPFLMPGGGLLLFASDWLRHGHKIKFWPMGPKGSWGGFWKTFSQYCEASGRKHHYSSPDVIGMACDGWHCCSHFAIMTGDSKIERWKQSGPLKPPLYSWIYRLGPWSTSRLLVGWGNIPPSFYCFS